MEVGIRCFFHGSYLFSFLNRWNNQELGFFLVLLYRHRIMSYTLVYSTILHVSVFTMLCTNPEWALIAQEGLFCFPKRVLGFLKTLPQNRDDFNLCLRLVLV